MSAGIIVIAEATPAGLTPASIKTISFARRLADETGEGLMVIIPGRFPEVEKITGEEAAAATSLPPGQRHTRGKLDNNASNIFALLEQTDGAETILLAGKNLDAYSAEAWMEALAPLCRELAPRILCLPHTSRGWDYGPGLAIRLEASLIGAVEDFRREEGDGVFLYRRSILKGQWQQEVRPEKWPVVLTVLPEAAVGNTPDKVVVEDTAGISTAGKAAVVNGAAKKVVAWIRASDAHPGKTATADVTLRHTAPDDTKAKADTVGDTVEETGSDTRGTNLSLSSPRYAVVLNPPASLSSFSPSRTAFYTAPASPDPRCRPLGKLPAGEAAYDFSAAEVIVAAGQGIGAAENLELIQRLAGLFPKAAVGCSRAVCDRGWMEYRRQIGMTGRTVAPPLYIACGISGAMPHLAGMRDSRCIVAVNRDKNAAIFQVAHLGVVADLLAFIPAVLEQTDRSHSGAQNG